MATKGAGAVRALCTGMIARQPEAAWAHRRLALLDLQEAHEPGQLERATASFQKALRLLPDDGALWEGLGKAFLGLTRLTAAHKAFARALDADKRHAPPLPLRQYAATQLAALQAALGQPHEALSTYRLALAACPDNAAALLGAAETHRARAAAELARAAPTLAAWDLASGWELAQVASRLHPHMTACWKLLGDMLVLHANATPCGPLKAALADDSFGHDLRASELLVAAADNATLAAACNAVELRLAAVRAAGTAYDRAAALVAADGGDVQGSGADGPRAMHTARLDKAAALYHEACVLESHPSLAAAAQSMTAALRDEAATTIRAALAVNPAAAELWGALGTVCHTSAQQEYALCRSLQLDRAAAWVWVALGRLYVAEGEGALADGCFEQARCANAATGSVWEAMGAAALALQQDATAARRLLHQATCLGAAAEPLANWAALGLGARAAALQRQGPCAINQRGSSEGAGDDAVSQSNGGEASDGDVAELLSAAHKAVQLQPLSAVAWHALGALLLADGAPHEAVDALHCAQALLATSATAPASLQLQGGEKLPSWVSLDLVAALVAGGKLEEARAEVDALGDGVEWGRWPWAAQTAATAFEGGGEAGRAVAVLQAAVQGATPGSEAWCSSLLAAVDLLCRLHRGEEALTMLTTCAAPEAAATVQSGLLTVFRATDGNVRAAAMAALRRQQPMDAAVASAALLADTHHAARALHTDPLSVDARLELARAAPAVHASAAARLVAPLLQRPSSSSVLRAAVWHTLRGATASSVAAWVNPTARRQLMLHVGRVMAVVHRQPGDWTAAAAAAVLQCRLAEARAAAGGDGNWDAVGAMCGQAEALWRGDTHGAHDTALHAHVLLSRSEALLRQGNVGAAGDRAHAALQQTRSGGAHTAAAHVQMARVLAARGEHAAAMAALDEAETRLTHAVAAIKASLEGVLPSPVVEQSSPQQRAVAAVIHAAQQVVGQEGACYQEVQPALKHVQQEAPGLAGGVHACVLLALAAVRDTDRKAKGRAESNAAKAICQWPGGVPASVWGVLVGGGVGGRVACCAVHACPWERRLWAGLPGRAPV